MGEPWVCHQLQRTSVVYSRTDPQGIARGGTAAMLWEFDQNGKFVKEWAPHNYAASFAHEVRIDRDDNVWQVDEGSGMIVKYNPKGQQVLWLGRTPEAIDYLERNLEILKYAHPMMAAPPKPVGRKENSTAKPMWPGIHKVTSSCPTVMAIRASSRFRRMAIG